MKLYARCMACRLPGARRRAHRNTGAPPRIRHSTDREQHKRTSQKNKKYLSPNLSQHDLRKEALP